MDQPEFTNTQNQETNRLRVSDIEKSHVGFRPVDEIRLQCGSCSFRTTSREINLLIRHYTITGHSPLDPKINWRSYEEFERRRLKNLLKVLTDSFTKLESNSENLSSSQHSQFNHHEDATNQKCFNPEIEKKIPFSDNSSPAKILGCTSDDQTLGNQSAQNLTPKKSCSDNNLDTTTKTISEEAVTPLKVDSTTANQTLDDFLDAYFITGPSEALAQDFTGPDVSDDANYLMGEMFESDSNYSSDSECESDTVQLSSMDDMLTGEYIEEDRRRITRFSDSERIHKYGQKRRFDPEIGKSTPESKLTELTESHLTPKKRRIEVPEFPIRGEIYSSIQEDVRNTPLMFMKYHNPVRSLEIEEPLDTPNTSRQSLRTDQESARLWAQEPQSVTDFRGSEMSEEEGDFDQFIDLSVNDDSEFSSASENSAEQVSNPPYEFELKDSWNPYDKECQANISEIICSTPDRKSAEYSSGISEISRSTIRNLPLIQPSLSNTSTDCSVESQLCNKDVHRTKKHDKSKDSAEVVSELQDSNKDVHGAEKHEKTQESAEFAKELQNPNTHPHEAKEHENSQEIVEFAEEPLNPNKDVHRPEKPERSPELANFAEESQNSNVDTREARKREKPKESAEFAEEHKTSNEDVHEAKKSEKSQDSVKDLSKAEKLNSSRTDCHGEATSLQESAKTPLKTETLNSQSTNCQGEVVSKSSSVKKSSDSHKLDVSSQKFKSDLPKISLFLRSELETCFICKKRLKRADLARQVSHLARADHAGETIKRFNCVNCKFRGLSFNDVKIHTSQPRASTKRCHGLYIIEKAEESEQALRKLLHKAFPWSEIPKKKIPWFHAERDPEKHANLIDYGENIAETKNTLAGSTTDQNDKIIDVKEITTELGGKMQCLICKELVKCSGSLALHSVQHILPHDPAIAPFKCKSCTLGFPTKMKIREHFKTNRNCENQMDIEYQPDYAIRIRTLLKIAFPNLDWLSIIPLGRLILGYQL